MSPSFMDSPLSTPLPRARSRAIHFADTLLNFFGENFGDNVGKNATSATPPKTTSPRPSATPPGQPDLEQMSPARSHLSEKEGVTSPTATAGRRRGSPKTVSKLDLNALLPHERRSRLVDARNYHAECANIAAQWWRNKSAVRLQALARGRATRRRLGRSAACGPSQLHDDIGGEATTLASAREPAHEDSRPEAIDTPMAAATGPPATELVHVARHPESSSTDAAFAIKTAHEGAEGGVGRPVQTSNEDSFSRPTLVDEAAEAAEEVGGSTADSQGGTDRVPTAAEVVSTTAGQVEAVRALLMSLEAPGGPETPFTAALHECIQAADLLAFKVSRGAQLLSESNVHLPSSPCSSQHAGLPAPMVDAKGGAGTSAGADAGPSAEHVPSQEETAVLFSVSHVSFSGFDVMDHAREAQVEQASQQAEQASDERGSPQQSTNQLQESVLHMPATAVGGTGAATGAVAGQPPSSPKAEATRPKLQPKVRQRLSSGHRSLTSPASAGRRPPTPRTTMRRAASNDAVLHEVIHLPLHPSGRFDRWSDRSNEGIVNAVSIALPNNED